MTTPSTPTPGSYHHPSVRTVGLGFTKVHATHAVLTVTEIMLGHLLVPRHQGGQQQNPSPTVIQNVNIIVPVVHPGPVVTTSSLNAAILAQIEVALGGLPRRSDKVIMKNIRITANVLASEPAPLAVAPDTSLLKRIQRLPTGPRSTNKNRPVTSQSSSTGSSSSRPVFNQPDFNQASLSPPTMSHAKYTTFPSRFCPSKFSPDSKV
ncbi:hypothetical protein N7475_008587 [Penicillium sp. IBT 31633x]|nr:hypothetical protein N7475_008587 [Penicillium sp. IBT 31633x]